MKFCATKGFQDSPRVQLWSKCIKWFPSCEVKLCPYPLLWPLAYTTACTTVHTMESIGNNTETPLGYGSHQTLDGNVSGKHCKLLRWVYRHSFRVLSRASRKSYGGMCDRSLWELKAGDQCESPTFSRWIKFFPRGSMMFGCSINCQLQCLYRLYVCTSVYPAKGRLESGSTKLDWGARKRLRRSHIKGYGPRPRPACDWPVPMSSSVQACVLTAGHCAGQRSWPVRTFSKLAILQRFPNFYT